MEIEGIQQYIAETNIPADLKDKYDLMGSEWQALAKGGSVAEMIALAFNFGFAKCYRAVAVATWYIGAITRLLDRANVRELDLIYRNALELVGEEGEAQA